MGVRESFWSGRRVLVTGDTGFKGSWLTLWLSELGATVFGVSLAPDEPRNLNRALGDGLVTRSWRTDIRDAPGLLAVFQAADPEVVFHLAAQSLVRRSYAEPTYTFDVNVRGTTNVLDATLATETVRAVVVVTSDKVYSQDLGGPPFSETDRLGGRDPYSASKACTELAVAAYRNSFFAERGIALTTARAGNVIGGGDWASDRLVPDCVRALERGESIALRYPRSVRPWQHVLDPLAGYLMAAEQMLSRPDEYPTALNFGPHEANCIPVHELVERISVYWDACPRWTTSTERAPEEAAVLLLSSDLALATLGWAPRLDLDRSLRWTAHWYSSFLKGKDVGGLSREQIGRYQQLGEAS